MSERPQTPEAVALVLMDSIIFDMNRAVDKKERLDIYAECLEATKGNRVFSN